MDSRYVYIYGAGGHGKVVADICIACGLEALACFVDDSPASAGRQPLGLPVVGNAEWLRDRAREQTVSVVLGVGGNRARRQVAQQLVAWGAQLLTVVHPSAVVAGSARLGKGTVVMAGAVINPDSDVGEGAIVNTGAVVEHDNRIGAFAHLSANAATGGKVIVGSESHLGLGAVVLPGITVGQRTVVGAGAVVTRDLPDDVVAAGVPARILRQL